ncbi:MAG: serine/threonine protein kinase, partial [Verrucomicrobiae bacterium]|nr:serine/threonine protein kinase [Verrucomicrobiae bacterium]
MRSGLQTAGEVYAGFLARYPKADEEAFARVCAAHPELGTELRRLNAMAAASKRRRSGDERSMRDDASAGRDPATQGLTGAWSRGGRYRIEGCVARGGMGVIYAVEDRELQRRIAMKVIGTGNGFQEPVPLDELPPSWVDRFMGEARITAQLDHPGVVPVHEAGLDPQGRQNFTMKLVRGRRLGKIFRLAREEREGWTLNRAVDALLRASLAVTHAHEQGIVHRDLKPDNIMVGRLGEVFVMDWGVARRLGRGDLHELRPAEPLSSRVRPGGAGPTTHQGEPATADSPVVTLDGTVIGTPAYMSP